MQDDEKHSLVHWRAAIGNVRLDKITRPMITNVIKSRLAAGIKPRTVNIDVIVLRNVLKEAKEDGLTSFENAARIQSTPVGAAPTKTNVSRSRSIGPKSFLLYPYQ